MTTKSTLPGFHDNDLILKPYLRVPDIDDNIGQSISYLMARYSFGQYFHTVQCDAQGRLLVTNAGVGTQVVNQFVFSVTAAEQVILQPNAMRTQVIIQNNSTNTVAIGLVQGQTNVSGINVNPGSLWSSDNWNGAIYIYGIIGTFPSNVVVQEF